MGPGSRVVECVVCGCKFKVYRSKIMERVGAGRHCSKECGRVGQSKAIQTHGESRTRLYECWRHMKSRCYNPNNVAWSYYGGRGVKVCNVWLNSYKAFREWAMRLGYTDDLELDRIDVDGDYEPSNCRWVNRVEQMRNTRKRTNAKTSKYKGVSWCTITRKWKAQIVAPGRKSYIGIFRNEVDAARAYDAEATRWFGEHAHLNFKKEG